MIIVQTKQVKLGSLCTITSSKRIFEHEYVEDGIPFYRSKEIIEKESGKPTSLNICISVDRFKEIKSRFGVPKPNDMLITSVGTLGIPYIVKQDDLFYFKDGNLTWLKNFSNLLDPKYLYYWIKSDFGKQSLIQRAIGSSQPAITIDILKKYQILIPDVVYQKKIASILSTYDDLIEKNNRKVAILQTMAEELYKEWFVRFRFPGYKTVKFYEGLPEGWEYGTIKDLGSFVRGKNITADEMEEGDIPVISAGIEPSGFHNESNVQGISLTISSSGANAGFLRINYSDIWAADCSFLNDLENIFYMYELLNNMRPCIDNLQRGAAQPHVYPKDINKLKIVLPPIQLRTKFNEIAKQVHLAIATLQKQNKNLTQQRDLLLPRLMSGKLEVKA